MSTAIIRGPTVYIIWGRFDTITDKGELSVQSWKTTSNMLMLLLVFLLKMGQSTAQTHKCCSATRLSFGCLIESEDIMANTCWWGPLKIKDELRGMPARPSQSLSHGTIPYPLYLRPSFLDCCCFALEHSTIVVVLNISYNAPLYSLACLWMLRHEPLLFVFWHHHLNITSWRIIHSCTQVAPVTQNGSNDRAAWAST